MGQRRRSRPVGSCLLFRSPLRGSPSLFWYVIPLNRHYYKCLNCGAAGYICTQFAHIKLLRGPNIYTVGRVGGMHTWNGLEWKRERLPGDLPSVVFYHCTKHPPPPPPPPHHPTPPLKQRTSGGPSHSALIRSLSSLMNTSAELLQSGNSAALLCAERKDIKIRRMRMFRRRIIIIIPIWNLFQRATQ